jgi:hypothetical protein
MNPGTPEFRRAQALLALKCLSPALASDVLADGAIVRRFGFSLIRPTQLSDDLTVKSDTLLNAFRAAADGTAIPPVVDANDAPLNATVRIDAKGIGIVEAGGKGWSFAYAALLSSDAAARRKALDAALAANTINTRDIAALQSVIANPTFSNDDFFSVIGVLNSSLETFSGVLRKKLSRGGKVGADDLLPDDLRHWDHLTAPLGTSASLAEFIDNELAHERRARLSQAAGFASVSLTFAAPLLVPRDYLAGLDADRLLGMLESSVYFDDPFGLASSLQICADRAEDSRFVELGDQFLDRLLEDKQSLKNACGIFAAAFVLATARLATHEVLRHRPVFWRRLAAASHAALIIRTCGVSDVGDKELLAWAIRVFGPEYMMSVYNEMSVEPQWRPEWIDSRYLMADVFGRIYAAFAGLAEAAAPESWKRRIEAAKKWAEDEHLDFIMDWPAVLEGAPRPKRELPPEHAKILKDAAQLIVGKPSIDNLLRITGIVNALGVPDGIGPTLLRVVVALRREAGTMDRHALNATVSVIAQIAALTKDAALAEATAEASMEFALSFADDWTMQHLVYRLVECSSADPDREKALAALAERLRALAFRLPASNGMAGLGTLLESVQKVVPALAPALGGAVAAAKLAVPSSA